MSQSRRHIAEEGVLQKFRASIISDDEGAHIGINISGWNIMTSSSSIGNESEMEALTDFLQHQISDSRRLALPEIVFTKAYARLTRRDIGKEQEVNDNDSEPLAVIRFTAKDALEEWASCHNHLETDGKDKNSLCKGVAIIKSVDAKLWEERQARERKQQQKVSSTNSHFGKGAVAAALKHCSTEFNYDWTFSSPYTGTSLVSGKTKAWTKAESSGINFSLLTDQSQPILFFDDVTLYEDDMHDNGYVSLKCKIRVMPTCFFILQSLFDRVDNVTIRVKEVRIFAKFENDGEIKISKDVCWREIPWNKLISLGLPSHVGSWRIEEEGMQQTVTGMIRKLPQIQLPIGVYEHSSFLLKS